MRILALGEDLWHSSTLEQWIGSVELELDRGLESVCFGSLQPGSLEL